MFRYIKKVLNALQSMRDKKKNNDGINDESNEVSNISKKISNNLHENLKIFTEIAGTSNDIIIRHMVIGRKRPVMAALIYIDGLINYDIINSNIIKPLMQFDGEFDCNFIPDRFNIKDLMHRIIYAGEMHEFDNFKDVIDGCLSGDAVLLVEGLDQALDVSSKGWDKRSVTEPQTEAVIRGPREGFTENFRTNTALIRRKIKSPLLRMDHMEIGKQTKTRICVAYLKDIAKPELIKTIKDRLQNINTDSILETGYIEQYIEDSPFSIFSTIGYSEKPDVVAAKMLEGRAAIIVDGTPFVLTAPKLFIENFQSAEDYYSRTFHASLIRIIRYIAFFITMLGPSLYVAFSAYHQELIPTTLLFTMAQSREGVPFPAFFEAFIMILTFEILNEAGLRMPRPIGQAVSIVGALVIGEAAVSAGFVGAPIVIIIAITAVSGFVIPVIDYSMSILRLIFVVLSAIMGGYGIIIGFLGLLIHLASLTSFGTPFMGYIAPSQPGLFKDVFIRTFLWKMKKRPHGIVYKNIVRQDFKYPPVENAIKEDKNDDPN